MTDTKKTVKLYRVRMPEYVPASDNNPWDDVNRHWVVLMIVSATSESDARTCASENYSDEPPSIWLDRENTECLHIGDAVEGMSEGLVLAKSYFN